MTYAHPTFDIQSKRRIVGINDKRSIHTTQRICQSRMTGEVNTIPVQLIGTNLYPDEWKHNCWWCCHTFKSKPVGCPVKYTKHNNTYCMRGYFCSRNCAKAWGLKNLSNSERNSLGMLMTHIAFGIAKANKIKFDIDTFHKDTIRAPHYTNLKVFGGNLTIKAFRTQHCKPTCLVSIPQNVKGIKLIPMGYDVFKLDNTETILLPHPNTTPKPRPKKETKNVKNTSKSTQSKCKRKSASYTTKDPSPMKTRTMFHVTKSVRATQESERLVMHKKAKTIPSSQTSIGSMMNLKFT